MAANAYEEAKAKLAALERETGAHWESLVGKFLGAYLGEVAPLVIALQADVAALRSELRAAISMLGGNEPDETLTVEGAAKHLKVHQRTVLKLANRGELPFIRVGRNRRFFKRDLVAHK